ncbi:HAD family hydrolase [Streptomyces bacillaris]|uniref:HAD family hydrolase n=1 Tax=Streptomyces bacillaris TaxID=68179 RepID=UPI003EC10EF4
MPTPSTAPVHIVWDWNGTLLDDLHCMVEAVSACQAAIGEPAVDTATYRQQHCLPGRRFHGRLSGRPVTDAEWPVIQRTYAEHMSARKPPLRAGAAHLLQWIAAHGHTQSLLSLTDDPQLRREVEQTRLKHLFQRIDGRRAPGTPKSAALQHHLAMLGEPDRCRVILIGDTTDDAAAARTCEVRAVLHTGGFELASRLRTAGAPVVPSLDAAALLALDLSAGTSQRPYVPDILLRRDARHHR